MQTDENLSICTWKPSDVPAVNIYLKMKKGDGAEVKENSAQKFIKILHFSPSFYAIFHCTHKREKFWREKGRIIFNCFSKRECKFMYPLLPSPSSFKWFRLSNQGYLLSHHRQVKLLKITFQTIEIPNIQYSSITNNFSNLTCFPYPILEDEREREKRFIPIMLARGLLYQEVKLY